MVRLCRIFFDFSECKGMRCLQLVAPTPTLSFLAIMPPAMCTYVCIPRFPVRLRFQLRLRLRLTRLKFYLCEFCCQPKAKAPGNASKLHFHFHVPTFHIVIRFPDCRALSLFSPCSVLFFVGRNLLLSSTTRLCLHCNKSSTKTHA